MRVLASNIWLRVALAPFGTTPGSFGLPQDEASESARTIGGFKIDLKSHARDGGPTQYRGRRSAGRDIFCLGIRGTHCTEVDHHLWIHRAYGSVESLNVSAVEYQVHCRQLVANHASGIRFPS